MLTAPGVTDMDALVAWCQSVEQTIVKYGLKETVASN